MRIEIRGARTHNLKGVDLTIGDGLTVVTGVSGSGKTSLVFDTLYHEARRRLIDVVATSRPGGWRHQLAPAHVESITGLGPAIAVGQNRLNRNPLSTLATAAGLHPYLRLLFTNYGVRHCPRCGSPLSLFTEDEIVERVKDQCQDQELRLFAPLLHGVPGSHRTLLDWLSQALGACSIWVDGTPWTGTPLAPMQPHDLEVELGALHCAGSTVLVRELVRRAAALGAHALTVRGAGADQVLATAPVCTACGAWFGSLEPKHFHQPCPHCDGAGCDRCGATGMHPHAAGVRWQGLRLPELLEDTVADACRRFSQPDLPSTSVRLQAELSRRLDALSRVGLGYLTLDRPSPTLSRGESQRVRLALLLTGHLEDVLHVLDEPTIGQHPADVERLLPAFRALDGPVVFVEHDRIAAAQADRAVDLGPGAGTEGGQVVFDGTPAGLWASETSTGRFFSLRERLAVPSPRALPDRFLGFHGAHCHNLKGIDVEIPLGRMTVIAGVSGSGKSTLVGHVIVPSLEQGTPVGCREISGPAVAPVMVDQSPIGHNPRSNPATYTKLADCIRDLFSQATGLSPSHYSFNRPEGACPTCDGMGSVEVTMQLMEPIWIPCADCGGQRFGEQVLSARVPIGGQLLSIADFYQLSIEDVARLLSDDATLAFLPSIPPARLSTARRLLRALLDVGLGYLPLGQPSPTLSGGEAQRVKLTRYLGQPRLAGRLLVLDEPSTGLHPKDLDGLLLVLDRLVHSGATVVVVEHNTDVMRAADWIIDLGPGAGPQGGHILYAGPPRGLLDVGGSPTAQALREEQSLAPRSFTQHAGGAAANSILIRNARANNLKGLDAEIPKGKLTVLTGVSGSGKSSLLGDVLEAEARRRYLESLSMYERQGMREGPEAPVDSITGLGVTLTVRGLQPHLWSTLTHFTRRASVGRATELSHHLAVLLAAVGRRRCLQCGADMVRGDGWLCPACGAAAPIAQPRHFSTTNYASACDRCTGLGVLLSPRPEKLIVHPERPLCGGAMHSPGYWPQTYLCQDTGICQALGARYGYDPFRTPWNEMGEEARTAFLFGSAEPLECTYRSKSRGSLVTHTQPWQGFFGGWVTDWDVHGTYTHAEPCPRCSGSGLKPEFLAVTLDGHNVGDLSQMPLEELDRVLSALPALPESAILLRRSLDTARRRLRFLRQVGLGYLDLDRPSGTLSAGEAQRLQLAGLLGSGLTSLTILLDEPSRGMHPVELEALRGALEELRDEGNTIIVVEHDLLLIRAADHVIDLGPGAGAAGGRIVAYGSPSEVAQADSPTGRWLRGTNRSDLHVPPAARRQPKGWLTVRGARANNLKSEAARFPLGTLTGICGVSGSGKSTLVLDTLGRALVRAEHTTSFIQQPSEPGQHDTIEGAPSRVVLIDQSRQGVHSPASFLGLVDPLLALYAAGEDAQALGLGPSDLGRPCSACKGAGVHRMQMGFLPDLFVECETCRGTGCRPEAWDVSMHGYALPEINALTFDQVAELFPGEERLIRPLEMAHRVGLGYLVWRQPSFTLSGGEAQRLKIARELCRRAPSETLFILDEPTVGQHMDDVLRLVRVLSSLADAGHTLLAVEHHPHFLAACDWLLELGPGGGPEGGHVVAEGTPELVASGSTATAPYLREVLEAAQ
ncbi:MAG TPA: ATP-binding cassette domain-containing protein [Anaerolineae bacterium]|nr:ATP-binding cassette domain-containing protein [Anaerolineae bacterium]